MIKTVLMIMLVLQPFCAYANTDDEKVTSLNSFTIALATFKAATKINGSCLNYKLPKGVCIWLSPNLEKTVTPLLDHYLPDLVVVIYRNADENPWTEARLLFDQTSNMAQKQFLPNVGSGNHAFVDQHEADVIFKEADVIGNPGLATLTDYSDSLPLLLKSTATPGVPYFQSMMDSALWRGLMPYAAFEEKESFVLGALHHVGKGLRDWGGVFPHEGAVMGNDDAKASMVIAQRAVDLLTRENTFGHIYKPLKNECGEECKAEPIAENSEDTLFQLIYPMEKDDCTVLGSNDSYQSEMLNEKGAYAWIVWRHYQGCPDGEGKYIGKGSL